MSSSEDKYEVSKDKPDRGQKGKEQTVSRGVYKDVEGEDPGGHNFSTQRKT